MTYDRRAEAPHIHFFDLADTAKARQQTLHVPIVCTNNKYLEQKRRKKKT